MNQPPLSTVVIMKESAMYATAIHRGKEPKPNHSYLIHKIINQCHSLAARKGLGKQIRQVSCCVLLCQLEHASSYCFPTILIGNTVIFSSQCRIWCWWFLVNSLIITKYISGNFNRIPKHLKFVHQCLYQFRSIIEIYELRTENCKINDVLDLNVSNNQCLVAK